jgi:hypothetical protein
LRPVSQAIARYLYIPACCARAWGGDADAEPTIPLIKLRPGIAIPVSPRRDASWHDGHAIHITSFVLGLGGVPLARFFDAGEGRLLLRLAFAHAYAEAHFAGSFLR